MSNFILTDRKNDYLLPPSVNDWLTQDHLARFVVEVIDGLDLSHLTRQYAGRGSREGALQRIEEEHGTTADVVGTVQFVDGARQIDGSAGMSAPENGVKPVSKAKKRSPRDKNGRICAGCA